jgi:hypothetical protein
MSNCTQFDNKVISRATLEHMWNFKVMKATVLFLKSNTQLTFCNKTRPIQHKARTGNCTLDILTRIQIDAFQQKEL